MSIFSRTKDSAAVESVFDAPTNAVEDISGDYVIDASHSRIGFSARHAMVTTVRGAFKEFEGTARIDSANPSASSVRLTINTASIDTGNADRDGHLVSPDFFDAKSNPEITFVSTKVDKVDDETWAITGDLTISGTTQSITVAFDETGSAQDPFGNTRVGFEGSTAINRKDWGLTWNAALETGGVLVSEKIKLEFDVSAIRNA
jgi:polyisoprenoid-binding protein YceI